MKKLTLLLIVCILPIATFAQVKNAGKFGTEIYLNLWNEDNTFSLIEGVKFRYFISDKFAIRGNINLSNDHHKTFQFERENNYEYPPDWIIISTTEKSKSTTNLLTFGFMPGVEYHVTNHKRISVYVGGEAGFEIQRYSTKENIHNRETRTKGVNGTNINSFKIGAFTGIDIYLLKNLYLGAELGLQYKTGKNLKATTKTEYPDRISENINKDYDKISHIGFYCLPSLRIGWNF